jgi:hypothetical protein
MRFTTIRLNPAAAVLAALVVSSLMHASPARGLVLTFDPVSMNFEHVNQDYGDRVTMTPQNGLSYGTDGGFTPNIVVDYGILPTAIPSYWQVGYGDLVNVLYEDQDGYGYLEVTFTADSNWDVQVSGFDMAAYALVNPINSVTVRDGYDTVLFSQTDVLIPATGHLAFTFDPPLQGHILIVAFDAHNLGTLSDDICIDNIEFSQTSDLLAVETSTWGRVKALYRDP